MTSLPSLLLLTHLIGLGLILLTASGIGWLLLGYEFTALLGVRLALVVAIWVLGPVIGKVAEPKFQKLAPVAGEPASPAFIQVEKQYLMLEIVATGLFYVIIVMWVLA